MTEIYMYMQKSKTQNGTKQNTKIMKKQVEKGLNRVLDWTLKGIGP